VIRREFLKTAAVLASGLAAKISHGAPCWPQLDGAANETCNPSDPSDPSNLERRTGELTSSNTPQLGVNYFRSEDGDQYEILNNRTSQQGSSITWQVQGIYYDPIRRILYQLDKQHASEHLEHAEYDEVAGTAWTKITPHPDLDSGGGPSHWRQAVFIPETGYFWHQKESSDAIHFYDPNTGVWGKTIDAPDNLQAGGSGPQGFGYHPNLYGPNKPGLLVANVWRFYAYNLLTELWDTLSTSAMSTGTDLYDADRGEGFYIPDRDELLMTARGKTNKNGQNIVYAVSAGAGNEANLSTANSAELRFAPPKQISGHSDNNKCYACMHPRQPNVLLAFPASNNEVWYTADGATTPWIEAPFTHPFASELTTDGKHTVGTLPHHGVVAGAASTTNNTRFVFWRPPLV